MTCAHQTRQARTPEFFSGMRSPQCQPGGSRGRPGIRCPGRGGGWGRQAWPPWRCTPRCRRPSWTTSSSAGWSSSPRTPAALPLGPRLRSDRSTAAFRNCETQNTTCGSQNVFCETRFVFHFLSPWCPFPQLQRQASQKSTSVASVPSRPAQAWLRPHRRHLLDVPAADARGRLRPLGREVLRAGLRLSPPGMPGRPPRCRFGHRGGAPPPPAQFDSLTVQYREAPGQVAVSVECCFFFWAAENCHLCFPIYKGQLKGQLCADEGIVRTEEEFAWGLACHT